MGHYLPQHGEIYSQEQISIPEAPIVSIRYVQVKLKNFILSLLSLTVIIITLGFILQDAKIQQATAQTVEVKTHTVGTLPPFSSVIDLEQKLLATKEANGFPIGHDDYNMCPNEVAGQPGSIKEEQARARAQEFTGSRDGGGSCEDGDGQDPWYLFGGVVDSTSAVDPLFTNGEANIEARFAGSCVHRSAHSHSRGVPYYAASGPSNAMAGGWKYTGNNDAVCFPISTWDCARSGWSKVMDYAQRKINDRYAKSKTMMDRRCALTVAVMEVREELRRDGKDPETLGFTAASTTQYACPSRCSNNFGCSATGPYMSTTPDCNSPIPGSVNYTYDASCARISDEKVNEIKAKGGSADNLKCEQAPTLSPATTPVSNTTPSPTPTPSGMRLSVASQPTVTPSPTPVPTVMPTRVPTPTQTVAPTQAVTPTQTPTPATSSNRTTLSVAFNSVIASPAPTEAPQIAAATYSTKVDKIVMDGTIGKNEKGDYYAPSAIIANDQLYVFVIGDGGSNSGKPTSDWYNAFVTSTSDGTSWNPYANLSGTFTSPIRTNKLSAGNREYLYILGTGIDTDKYFKSSNNEHNFAGNWDKVNAQSQYYSSSRTHQEVNFKNHNYKFTTAGGKLKICVDQPNCLAN